MIRFKFNEVKATQVASLFLQRNQCVMNYMRLIKLLYITDREALSRWERPLTGDSYFSMKRGPVLSNILDLINYGEVASDYWYKYISEPAKYNITLKKDPGTDELSKRELDLINEIFDKYKDYDEWQMVEICHKILPEWEHPGETSIPIRIEDILKEVQKTEREIELIEQETSNLEYVKKTLQL